MVHDIDNGGRRMITICTIHLAKNMTRNCMVMIMIGRFMAKEMMVVKMMVAVMMMTMGLVKMMTMFIMMMLMMMIEHRC